MSEARDNARDVLLIYASAGIPMSVRQRDRLWRAAEPDDEFLRVLRGTRLAREAREQKQDADMAWLAEQVAALERGEEEA